MRQNLIVALLSICCTLLGVQLVLHLQSSSLPVALGQAVGTPSGTVVLATGMTQSGNEAVLYLYDVTSQRLCAYTTKGQGIELKGVRQVTHDLKPVEFTPRGKSPSPSEMDKAVKKGGPGGSEEEKGK
ncbi:MAG TPA: hypothetical protein VFD71_06780 [Planctomycetota bacterium]|jgi:hypothetical protein|nr:hypothetical protein [Planctomycetota bacterium]